MFAEDLDRFARAFESDLRRVQQEVGDLLSSWRPAHARGSGPSVNLWTNAEGAVLTADLPGVRREDLEVTVLGDEVTLAGTRPADEAGEGSQPYARERAEGPFRRTVRLPFKVDPTGVDAKLDAGVLRLVLPRENKERPHRVEVGS